MKILPTHTKPFPYLHSNLIYLIWSSKNKQRRRKKSWGDKTENSLSEKARHDGEGLGWALGKQGKYIEVGNENKGWEITKVKQPLALFVIAIRENQHVHYVSRSEIVVDRVGLRGWVELQKWVIRLRHWLPIDALIAPRSSYDWTRFVGLLGDFWTLWWPIFETPMWALIRVKTSEKNLMLPINLKEKKVYSIGDSVLGLVDANIFICFDTSSNKYLMKSKILVPFSSLSVNPFDSLSLHILSLFHQIILFPWSWILMNSMLHQHATRSHFCSRRKSVKIVFGEAKALDVCETFIRHFYFFE